jgi:flagellar protein FliS
MSLNLAASPQTYRQSAILTASPERRVVMLYDGARRFLTQAAAAMRAGDVPTAHERLRRAESIIEHLSLTLDMEQGEIALRLRAIYDFCARHLAAGRMEPSADKLDQVHALLGELRDAWEQALESNPGAARSVPLG